MLGIVGDLVDQAVPTPDVRLLDGDGEITDRILVLGQRLYFVLGHVKLSKIEISWHSE